MMFFDACAPLEAVAAALPSSSLTPNCEDVRFSPTRIRLVLSVVGAVQFRDRDDARVNK